MHCPYGLSKNSFLSCSRLNFTRKGSLNKNKTEIIWSFTNIGVVPPPPLARFYLFGFDNFEEGGGGAEICKVEQSPVPLGLHRRIEPTP